MTRKGLFSVYVVLAVLVVSWPLVSWGEEPTQLGELSFPTSGSDEAQPKFLTGVKLLHNFADMEIDMAGVELPATASDLFASGLAAIRAGTTGAERALNQMVVLRSAAERNVKGSSHHHSSYFDGVFASSIRAARVMETQLEAIILLADGETGPAIARLRDAIAAEERLTAGYGPPVPLKPSHELLAEVLLNLDRPREAEEYFRQALQRTPRRTAALVGLAEAARRVARGEAERRARDELAKILGHNQPYQAWRALPPAK